MAPCPHCPAPDPSRCPALTIPHPYFCAQAADPACPAGVLRMIRGERALARPGGDPPRRGVPEGVAIDPIALAIDTCPDRLSCQCAEPIACRSRGPGSLARCRDCRAEALGLA